MSDAILEEIWRVRQKLLKDHGGMEGYFRHVRKLDQARRNAGRKKRKNAGTRKAKTPA